MATSMGRRRAKVLSLMPLAGVEEEYLRKFRLQFDLDVPVHPSSGGGDTSLIPKQILHVANHEEAEAAIAEQATKNGPYIALIIPMGTRPYEPFTPAFFTPLLPQLKLVVSASAGYDEMPVTFFTSQAVYFCNTRHAVAEPTADMTLYLLLAVIRDLSRSEKSAREGKWNRAHIPNRDPSGLTLGIIGMGGIGKHVARKAGAFNLKVTYYNRHRLPAADEEKHNVTYCETLEDLLNTSDVISIHCPLNSSTRHMLTTKEFALMKDGVLIINTARGAIIDEDALIAAMESGKVSRAGMDVFDDEPNIRPYFRESERCVLQPHLGGLTTRARRDAERECLENIVAWWKTGRPVAPVNEIESQ